ncbi:hypothetical protein FB565_003962 [Actinoplanes lutulentus]|uniref:Uncharacterized protein n=1 Tax=Actinoplanes lutulentus TaxID=1287878 RepID=A0A327ZN12_9ACTN|nr:hypothetical protein [Actinoplanes lutulentus]MBB2944233.1 hypothetical protein [Actinoplanes lutulentus]RAK42534.1 hypothetical protein B0I29_102359 [Actinoplanes lutulentus]
MTNRWLGRRKNPRLSGTLHILDATGRELAVPLRGRATVLTAGGTGLTGYGEVWAVHTTTAAADTSLMISYGHDDNADKRESGLCPAGDTVVLSGVRFTWRNQPAVPGTPIPRPRDAMPNMPRTAGAPPKSNASPQPSRTAPGRTPPAQSSPAQTSPTQKSPARAEPARGNRSPGSAAQPGARPNARRPSGS